MSERDIARVNQTAGRLSNGVAEVLVANGVTNAVVWVADGCVTHLPLATRNTMNNGFWEDGPVGYTMLKDLQRTARLQAEYAPTDPAMDAVEQAKKLARTDRTSTSYSPSFDDEMKPGYVLARQSGLTVTAAAPNVETERMLEMVARAVSDVEGGRKPNMLEAAKLMHACFELLEPELAKLNTEKPTGLAMLALPRYINALASDFDRFPAVVASQAVGRVVDPAKFNVVGAKALAVARTGRPSGMIEGLAKPKNSNILGGLPVKFAAHGERAMAVGGLKMEEDGEIIRAVANSPLGQELGMVVLDQLTRV